MLTRMVSISWPRDLPTSASQSAGIIGVSHGSYLFFCVWIVVVNAFQEICPFRLIVEYIDIKLSILFLYKLLNTCGIYNDVTFLIPDTVNLGLSLHSPTNSQLSFSLFFICSVWLICLLKETAFGENLGSGEEKMAL